MGKLNTAPVENTVEGEIYFDFPCFRGRIIPDIHLRWEKGELVEATASANQDFLQEVVKSDSGASRIGEFVLALIQK
jgi:aminopeptidase